MGGGSEQLVLEIVGNLQFYNPKRLFPTKLRNLFAGISTHWIGCWDSIFRGQHPAARCAFLIALDMGSFDSLDLAIYDHKWNTYTVHIHIYQNMPRKHLQDVMSHCKHHLRIQVVMGWGKRGRDRVTVGIGSPINSSCHEKHVSREDWMFFSARCCWGVFCDHD